MSSGRDIVYELQDADFVFVLDVAQLGERVPEDPVGAEGEIRVPLKPAALHRVSKKKQKRP